MWQSQERERERARELGSAPGKMQLRSFPRELWGGDREECMGVILSAATGWCQTPHTLPHTLVPLRFLFDCCREWITKLKSGLALSRPLYIYTLTWCLKHFLNSKTHSPWAVNMEPPQRYSLVVVTTQFIQSRAHNYVLSRTTATHITHYRSKTMTCYLAIDRNKRAVSEF